MNNILAAFKRAAAFAAAAQNSALALRPTGEKWEVTLRLLTVGLQIEARYLHPARRTNFVASYVILYDELDRLEAEYAARITSHPAGIDTRSPSVEICRQITRCIERAANEAAADIVTNVQLQETSDMDTEGTEYFGFETALDQIKQGARCARRGWDGKDMFVFLVPGSVFKVNRAPLLGIYPEGTEITYHAHIDMKTAQGYVVPWLASQVDLLADDWFIVEQPDG